MESPLRPRNVFAEYNSQLQDKDGGSQLMLANVAHNQSIHSDIVDNHTNRLDFKDIQSSTETSVLYPYVFFFKNIFSIFF